MLKAVATATTAEAPAPAKQGKASSSTAPAFEAPPAPPLSMLEHTASGIAAAPEPATPCEDASSAPMPPPAAPAAALPSQPSTLAVGLVLEATGSSVEDSAQLQALSTLTAIHAAATVAAAPAPSASRKGRAQRKAATHHATAPCEEASFAPAPGPSSQPATYAVAQLQEAACEEASSAPTPGPSSQPATYVVPQLQEAAGAALAEAPVPTTQGMEASSATTTAIEAHPASSMSVLRHSAGPPPAAALEPSGPCEDAGAAPAPTSAQVLCVLPAAPEVAEVQEAAGLSSEVCVQPHAPSAFTPTHVAAASTPATAPAPAASRKGRAQRKAATHAGAPAPATPREEASFAHAPTPALALSSQLAVPAMTQVDEAAATGAEAHIQLRTDLSTLLAHEEATFTTTPATQVRLAACTTVMPPSPAPH